MRPPLLDPPPDYEDIQALRRVIAQLAGRCGIDLGDRAVLRRVLDGDFGNDQAAPDDRQQVQELSAMLTLLFRLEACSSEDLGIAGLLGLWREHGRILARCRGDQLIAG